MAAAADSPKRLQRIDKTVAGWDRPTLLRTLGINAAFPLIADVAELKAASLEGKKPLKIHKSKVPFLDKGAALECCSGAKLMKYSYSLVATPCFSIEVLPDSQLCAHCLELWGNEQDDGYFVSKKDMGAVNEEYAPGETKLMTNWSCIREIEDKYHDFITEVKDMLEDSPAELQTNWPEAKFTYVLHEVLSSSPVVTADIREKQPSKRRSLLQQQKIALFAARMIPLWLRLRVFASKKTIHDKLQQLFTTAEAIATAATWKLQAAFPNYPIFSGPVTAADIILAGAQHAVKQFNQIVNGELKRTDAGEIEWGPRVQLFDAWANTVPEVERPDRSVLKMQQKKTSETPANGTPMSRRGYYAVARGAVPGIYRDDRTAREQIHEHSFACWKRCRSREEAQKFIEDNKEYPKRKSSAKKERTPPRRVRAAPSESMKKRMSLLNLSEEKAKSAWFVAKGTSRPGIYKHEHVAESYRLNGKGSITRSFSLKRAHDWFGPGGTVYEESTPRAKEAAAQASSQQVTLKEEDKIPKKYFAVFSGTCIGVYSNIADVATAVTDGGGEFAQCESQKEAWDLIALKQTHAAESSSVQINKFVVWMGKQVGIMSESECINATVGVEGARMAGPFTMKQAEDFWMQKQSLAVVQASAAQVSTKKYASYACTPVDTTSAAAAATGTQLKTQNSAHTSASVGATPDTSKKIVVIWPSDEDIAAALQANKKRAFGCYIAVDKGKLATSFEALVDDARDSEVMVSSSGNDIFENLAMAEKKLQNNAKTQAKAVSIADRIAAARAKVGTTSRTPGAAASARAQTAPAASSGMMLPSAGKPGGEVLGRRGLRRSREAAQILRVFVQDARPIEVRHAPANIHLFEITSVDLPGAKLYKTKGQTTIYDYYKSLDAKSGDYTWSLMGLSKFLAFCRQAQEVCKREGKDTAAKNITALGFIMDIAIRVHDMMSKGKALGEDEINFKIRMYLHLQVMSDGRELHVGPSAMANFRDAVPIFGQKVPGYVIDLTESPQKNSTKAAPSKPKFGCWVCLSPDHYVSKKTHPVKEKLSKATKDAIIARVRATPYPKEEQEEEITKMKAYWAQHKL